MCRTHEGLAAEVPVKAALAVRDDLKLEELAGLVEPEGPWQAQPKMLWRCGRWWMRESRGAHRR